jgi:four helix bundle protein
MRFNVLETALEAIRSLREPLASLRSRDPKLYQQIRTAASSIALNIGEGQGRRGRDRLHLWRVAAGSAEEVRTALRVAEAWGDLQPQAVAHPLALLDQVLAMLWRLTN